MGSILVVSRIVRIGCHTSQLERISHHLYQLMLGDGPVLSCWSDGLGL